MVKVNEIKSLVEITFNVEVINISKDLMDLGLIDSIEAMKLLTIIESEYKVNIPFTEYTQKGFFTVESIVNSINVKTE